MHSSHFATQASEHPVRAARNQVTLLLVDDDSTVREVLEAILRRAGYSVVTAKDGETAMEVASATSFDMLITDYQMPGMDGCALAASLTERRSWLPVLVVSGADPCDLPLDRINHGNWSYLPKPVDSNRMYQIIDSKCLGGAEHLAKNTQTSQDRAAL